jgi:hypothetical protein
MWTFTNALARRCVPSTAPLADLLRALSGVVDALGVGWYVFGAQAVLYWGRPRFTEDVDVTVILGRIEPARLVEGLQSSGFQLRVEGTPDFIAQTRLIPLAFGAGGWALDIVIGGPGLEETFLERAVRAEIAPGLIVPIIAAEDLLVTKILAGRPKDLDDVRGVLLEQGNRLDLPAVHLTLSMLEEALGVSDLVPVLDRLLKV